MRISIIVSNKFTVIKAIQTDESGLSVAWAHRYSDTTEAGKAVAVLASAQDVSEVKSELPSHSEKDAQLTPSVDQMSSGELRFWEADQEKIDKVAVSMLRSDMDSAANFAFAFFRATKE